MKKLIILLVIVFGCTTTKVTTRQDLHNELKELAAKAESINEDNVSIVLYTLSSTIYVDMDGMFAAYIKYDFIPDYKKILEWKYNILTDTIKGVEL